MSRHLLFVLAITAATPLFATGLPDCRATPQIFSATTLAGQSDIYFGDVTYRYAILLATNARSAEGFPFIGNPNQLPKGKMLCIPQIAEAEMLKNRFNVYEDAVGDMALPYPSEVSNDLDPLDISGPVTVASWVRADQADGWRDKLGQTLTIGKQTWVSPTPAVQQFCATYVNERGPNPAALTLRLEQRLGLAPNSAKTHFVEFEVANPGNTAQIFRPCASSDVTTTTCAFGPAQACGNPGELDAAGNPVHTPAEQGEIAACNAHYAFFTTQYYTSYGISLPTEFPWTSLGYTFDWAHRAIGLTDAPGFVQFGESEYVVPASATVTVKSVTDTGSYCAPS